MSDLFRKEVLDNKKNDGFGPPYLYVPRTLTGLTLFIVISIFLLGTFAVNKSFDRKVTVTGVLKSSNGVSLIVANRGGILRSTDFVPGNSIEPGQHLFKVISSDQDDNGTNTYEKRIEVHHLRINDVLSKVRLQKELADRERSRALSLETSLESSLWQSKKQLRIKSTLSEKLVEQHQKATKLLAEGYISELAAIEVQTRMLNQQQSMEETKKDLMQQRRDLDELKSRISEFPLKLKSKLLDYEQDIKALELSILNLQFEQTNTRVATQAGTIASVNVKDGETVSFGQLIMTIVPKNSEIEAELYVPSRAKGFLKVNQVVQVRYDSFPFQRYGLFGGTIKQINAVTSDNSQLNNLLVKEVSPYYIVKVKLDSQTVAAFGDTYNLQLGMALEADIIMDSMTMFEWLLMPLYSLQGRI
jgi:membrane fusion protein